MRASKAAEAAKMIERLANTPLKQGANENEANWEERRAPARRERERIELAELELGVPQLRVTPHLDFLRIK